MPVRRRAVLVVALGGSSALTVALGATDPAGITDYPTRFLAWNLVLAWMPLAAALGFTRSRQWWSRLGCGVAWLLFLPNAPYLVTDLVHLRGNENELWRHILEFGFAAWTGMLLGVVSLRIVHVDIERRHNACTGWLLVALATGLCAIGVVIGRFQRWNSWDLVIRPRAVAASTFDWVRAPVSNVRDTGVAVAVAAFFGIAYLTIWALDGLGASTRSATGRD